VWQNVAEDLFSVQIPICCLWLCTSDQNSEDWMGNKVASNGSPILY